MIQLTVGYVAGIIAAGIFVGTFAALLLNPDGPFRPSLMKIQREYGLQMSLFIPCRQSSETEHQHLLGKEAG
jgi:hypothetical protein